jgi:anaphase-promoting complex subunit 3
MIEEANIIFALAKVYRLMGNELESARTLAAVRDVSGAGSVAKIRKLLETVEDPSDGAEQMDQG